MSHNIEKAVLGGGCFWCLDATYQLIEGVNKVTSGYAGGRVNDPTYEAVSSGSTNHAEVVEVEFNPDQISYKDILDIFWAIHDPTTLNRQGADMGSQYRSIILYQNDKQQQIAQKSKAEVARLWKDPIVTEIVPLEDFFPAEDYHQNFYKKNPNQMYCQVVINPKLAKLREKFHSHLKSTYN
jgi:peptide-methionine (S)-S-oxide reductase